MFLAIAVVLIAVVSGYLWFAAPSFGTGPLATIAPVCFVVVVVVTLLVLARQAGRWRRENSLDDDDSNDAAHGKRVSGLGMARGRNVYFKR